MGFEPVPGGCRVIDANDLVLAHVYGEPPNAVATSPKRLTDDEARRISKLARLPELVEIERDRNRALSRRKPQRLGFKPVTIGDLISSGQAARGPLQLLPSGAPSLYRCPGASVCPSAWPWQRLLNYLQDA
jgi:hypothetical protein